MRSGGRKALYSRERDSLEKPYEEAQTQRKASRPGKNLVFSKDIYLQKSGKRPQRKVEVGLKRRGELNNSAWDCKLAWCESTEKNEDLLRLRERH